MKLKSGIPNYYKKLWKQDNQVRTSNYQINFDDFCKGEDEETEKFFDDIANNTPNSGQFKDKK